MVDTDDDQKSRGLGFMLGKGSSQVLRWATPPPPRHDVSRATTVFDSVPRDDIFVSLQISAYRLVPDK